MASTSCQHQSSRAIRIVTVAVYKINNQRHFFTSPNTSVFEKIGTGGLYADVLEESLLAAVVFDGIESPWRHFGQSIIAVEDGSLVHQRHFPDWRHISCDTTGQSPLGEPNDL